LPFRAEYFTIQILPAACVPWLAFEQTESPRPIGFPFGTQEKGVLPLSVRKPERKLIEADNEEDFDAFLQSRADDLPCNL